MAVCEKWLLLLTTFFILNHLCVVAPSKEVLEQISIGFAKPFHACKKELNLGDNMIHDFSNFWCEDYDLIDHDVGCMIVCMANFFELFVATTRFDRESAHDFALKHGADEALAAQVTTMLKDCELEYDHIKDDCIRVLQLAKCFRMKIHAFNWAPPMEVILQEILLGI